MTEHQGRALQVALAYYESWASKDLGGTMSYIADDVVCDAPAGRIEGAGAYRGFLESFFKLLKRAELIASFGDDETAILLYDNETVPVPSAPPPRTSRSRTARSPASASSSTGCLMRRQRAIARPFDTHYATPARRKQKGQQKRSARSPSPGPTQGLEDSLHASSGAREGISRVYLGCRDHARALAALDGLAAETARDVFELTPIAGASGGIPAVC